MKSWAYAALAAATISSSLAPGFAEFDVLADGPAEQEYVLSDIRNMLAERSARRLGNVLFVDNDLAEFGVIEAQDQVEYR